MCIYVYIYMYLQLAKDLLEKYHYDWDTVEEIIKKKVWAQFAGVVAPFGL